MDVLIWVHYLERALQTMYVLACDKHDLVEELTAENTEFALNADASIAERDEPLDEVSSYRAQIAT